eukprot:XP_001691423.1 hypothetical protein CHLREDRAFT_144978 [Chlamydomonas reinhardtii]
MYLPFRRFTFIAAYAIISHLSPFDAATHTALFLICRRVPYLLLFPVTGLAADRLNRGALLVAVCLAEGAVSFTLPLVQQQQNIWLLYPLIFCQYCAQAFYDPARAAAIPGVVPRHLICVAGTLDTFGFSLMALGGAALLTAALPAAGKDTERPWSGMGSVAAAAAAAAAAAPEVEAPPELQPLLATHSSQADDAGLLHKRGAPSRGGHGAGSPGNLGAGAGEGEDVSMCGASGTCGALAFIAQRQNWDVAILIWIKATGAMVWGAADILNGRFSTDRAMQSLGGPDQTLGFILAAVGGGCVVGPLIANSITPGVARYWRVSVASAFGLLAAGYAVMAAAPSIFWILPATCIRAAGQYTVRYKAVLIRLHEWQLARVKSVGPCSNTLYIHSFAILQHRLHEGIRGRVFAVEFVFFTISEASSSLAAGWALDGLGWSERQLSTAMALLASGFMAEAAAELAAATRPQATCRMLRRRRRRGHHFTNRSRQVAEQAASHGPMVLRSDQHSYTSVNATYLVGITAPSGQVVEAMLAAQLRPGAPVWLQCAFEAVTRVCFSLEALGRAPGSAAGGAVGSGAASPPPPPPAALLTAGLAGSLRVMAASVSLRCGPGADWPPGGSLSEVRAQLHTAVDALSGCSRGAFSPQLDLVDLHLSCSRDDDRQLFTGRCDELRMSQALTDRLQQQLQPLGNGSSSGDDSSGSSSSYSGSGDVAAWLFVLPLGELLHVLGELEHAGVAAGPLAPDTDREDDRSSALGCGAAGGAPLCPPLGGVCPNAPQFEPGGGVVRITPDWLTPASYGLNLYLAHRRAPTAAAAATTGNSSASGGAVRTALSGRCYSRVSARRCYSPSLRNAIRQDAAAG